MATFGAPVSRGDDIRKAVNAAMEMHAELSRRSSSGELPPTRIGIGIHCGYVVTGNVGTKVRKQFSVTGTTVILASGIEQLNKTYGSAVLVSREVLNRVHLAEISPTIIGEVPIKGSRSPIEIVRLA